MLKLCRRNVKIGRTKYWNVELEMLNGDQVASSPARAAARASRGSWGGAAQAAMHWSRQRRIGACSDGGPRWELGTGRAAAGRGVDRDGQPRGRRRAALGDGAAAAATGSRGGGGGVYEGQPQGRRAAEGVGAVGAAAEAAEATTGSHGGGGGRTVVEATGARGWRRVTTTRDQTDRINLHKS